MASFPGSVKSFATRSAGQTIQPAHVNDLQDEVNAIEDGYINGTAHLNSSHSTLAALSVTGGSTLASTITIGSLPYVFPASGGSTGQVLTIDSTSGSPMTLKWAAAVSPAAVRLELDTPVGVPSGSTVTIQWTRQAHATNSSMHSTSVNPDRVTPQSSGIYLCIASARFLAATGKTAELTIYDSSGGVIADMVGSTLAGLASVSVSGVKYFDTVAGSTQWVRVEAYNEGSTNSLSTQARTHFSVVKIG